MHEWSPEIVVDRELARELIGGQFPELAPAPLELFGAGWDNSVWLAGERWLFRFPQRALALPGVERELAILPRLAPLVPLPIPDPAFVGRPAGGYPWPFFGYERIQGVEPAGAELSDAARRAIARDLGAFLRALHAGEVLARVDPDGRLPADPMGRTDMGVRVPRTRQQLGECARLGLWCAPGQVAGWLDEALALPPAAPSALVHGDLHVRHVLVGPDGALSGVIDWGDVCRADPAADLSLYWSLLPPSARQAFLAAYGPVAPEQLLRARVLALFLCAALALYARHERRPALEREAVAGLARACR